MNKEQNEKINDLIEEIEELFEGNTLPVVMTALIKTISSILVTQIPTEEMSMDVFGTMVKGIGDTVAIMIEDGATSWKANRLN